MNTNNVFFKQIKVLFHGDNSIFNCPNPRGLELSLQLRLGLSHLCEHRFNQSMVFKALLMRFASVGIGEIEACCHFLRHCSNYSTQKLDLVNSIINIDSSILQKNNMNITLTLIFGNSSYDSFKNSIISDKGCKVCKTQKSKAEKENTSKQTNKNVNKKVDKTKQKAKLK